MLHLREGKRKQDGNRGVIFKGAAEDVSGVAQFAANVGDAEDEDATEEPRDGVRVRAGVRGRHQTDESPENAGDGGGINHSKLVVGSHGDLGLENGVERVDEVLQNAQKSFILHGGAGASRVRVETLEEVEDARVEALALATVFFITTFILQCAPERQTHKVERDSVREAGDDGDGLNHLQTTAVDERTSERAFGEAPVNLLQNRRAFVAHGRDQIVDVRTRVRRRDEVKRDGDEDQSLERARQRTVRFDDVKDVIRTSSARQWVVTSLLQLQTGGVFRQRRVERALRIAKRAAVHGAAAFRPVNSR